LACGRRQKVALIDYDFGNICAIFLQRLGDFLLTTFCRTAKTTQDLILPVMSRLLIALLLAITCNAISRAQRLLPIRQDERSRCRPILAKVAQKGETLGL